MQNYHKITKLVGEGGGTRGIAFIGAIRALGELGVLQNITGFAGSSAGSIPTGFLACGASPDQIAEYFKIDFSKFQDNSFGIMQDIWRLLFKWGWNKGVFFEDWYRGILAELTGVEDPTFRYVYDKFGNELVVTASSLTYQLVKYFSKDNTPEFSIARAVRASMAIPGIFTPVITKSKEVLVDGGLFENYPITIFDVDGKPNPETLGLLLVTPEEIERKPIPIENAKDYWGTVLKGLIGNSERVIQDKADWNRTIPIDTGDIGATDFDLSEEAVAQLISSGYDAVMLHLEGGKS